MSNRDGSIAVTILEVQNMIVGLQKHMAGQTVVIGGVTMLVTDVIAKLQNYIAQLMAATAAQSAWHQQVQAVDELESSDLDPFRLNLGKFLRGTYGNSAGVLGDFGLKPRKAAKRSAAGKNAAVEKDLATREARDTKGPREKEDVHGTVPAAPPPAGNNPGGKSG